MKWFKHLSRAHADGALEKLISEFGVEGYGLYFYCLELIAGSVEENNVTFELEHDAKLLARRLNMDTLKVENIMKRCLALGLFELSTSGRVACISLAHYIDPKNTRNAQILKIIKQLPPIVPDSPRLSAPDYITLHDITLQKKNIPPSKTKSTPNPDIKRIINYYVQLLDKRGLYESASFPGGQAGIFFKRLLKKHTAHEIGVKIKAWFTDEWGGKVGYAFGPFQTSYPRIGQLTKDGKSHTYDFGKAEGFHE